MSNQPSVELPAFENIIWQEFMLDQRFFTSVCSALSIDNIIHSGWNVTAGVVGVELELYFSISAKCDNSDACKICSNVKHVDSLFHKLFYLSEVVFSHTARWIHDKDNISNFGNASWK